MCVCEREREIEETDTLKRENERVKESERE